MVELRAGRGRSLDSARTRAAVTIGDQLLSSLSNFALGVVVAVHVSVEQYGLFGVVYSVYGIVLGVTRAAASEPLVVRHSGGAAERRPIEGRRSLAAGALLGLGLGLVCVAVGAVWGGSGGTAAIALGVGLPFLLVQDGYRYYFFVVGRPHQAVVIDAVWNGAFLGALVAVPALRTAATPAPFLLAWAGAAAVSVATGLVLAAAGPRLSEGGRWLRTHLDIAPRFTAEFLVNSASTHLIIYATALLAGYGAVGALRGGYQLMGPLWVACNGLVAGAVPEGVRLRDRSLGRLVVGVHVLAGVLTLLALTWGVLAVHLPDPVGRSLLGATWPEVQPLMAGLTLFGAGFVATSGFVAGLRSLAAARRSFRATVPTGVLIVVGGSIGAAMAGSSGAVAGTVAPVWLGLAAVAWQFRRAVAQRRATTPEPVR